MSGPNTGNPAFFGVKVSKPGVDVQKASPQDLVYQNDYTTTTYYDSSNSRILLGQLPDGTYGIWVSAPGQDVTTATSNQLILDSGTPSFKIIGSGTTVITLLALPAQTATEIPHGLGFAPFVQGFINIQPAFGDDEWTPLAYTETTIAGFIVTLTHIEILVDETNVVISAQTTDDTSPGDYTVKYFLLAATL